MSIHIKPENRGKFNATKARTGKSTEELTHSSNPVTKKRAVFAQNAAKWKHANGGPLLVGKGLKKFAMGGDGIDWSGSDSIFGGQGEAVDVSGQNSFSNPETFKGTSKAKTSYRGYIGAAANIAGGAARSTKGYNTQFGDFRDDTDNATEAGMQAVGNFGVVGSAIKGAYDVINAVAKPMRAKAEATDAYGQLKTPKKAQNLAVIGAQLDPITAISTRAKLGLWGTKRSAYTDKLQEKLYEKYNAQQQPFLQARNQQLNAIAGQQNLQERPAQSQYYRNGGALSRGYLKTMGFGGDTEPDTVANATTANLPSSKFTYVPSSLAPSPQMPSPVSTYTRTFRPNPSGMPVYNPSGNSTEVLEQGSMRKGKLDPASYLAKKKLLEENGSPDVTTKEGAWPHYNPLSSTIILPTGKSPNKFTGNLIEETAHSKQDKESSIGQGVAARWTKDWLRSPAFSFRDYQKFYRPRVTGPEYMEYDAHGNIAPGLHARYGELRDSLKDRQNKGLLTTYRNGGQTKTVATHTADSKNWVTQTPVGYDWKSNAKYNKAVEDTTPKQREDFSPAVNYAGNVSVQTLLDQTGPGKLYNMYNTGKDAGKAFKNKDYLKAANLIGSEFVKLGAPVIGDMVVNAAQEGYSPSGNSFNQLKKDASTVSSLYKKANGGTVKRPQAQFTDYTGTQMYGPGGQLPPIYVNDPNDKRFRSYKDSLYSYNFGKKLLQDYKKVAGNDVVPVIRGSKYDQLLRENVKPEQLLDNSNALDSDLLNKDMLDFQKNGNRNIKPIDFEAFISNPDNIAKDLLTGRSFVNMFGIGKRIPGAKIPQWKQPVQPVELQQRPVNRYPDAYNYGQPYQRPKVEPKKTSPRMQSLQAQRMQSSPVSMQGQPMQIQPMTLPQQKGKPVYGPGNTIIGYNGEDGMMKKAYQYTGAPNNDLNLQDKALLEDKDKWQQYLSSKDSGYKFATGGSMASNYMANQKAVGGSIQPMSKDASIAVGPSHEQGGIALPDQQAEIEGGETMSGDYVFSKQLGFAALHKPIAKAQGKIEAKASTPERLNTLKLLADKTNKLKLAQEYMKKQLNLQ